MKASFVMLALAATDVMCADPDHPIHDDEVGLLAAGVEIGMRTALSHPIYADRLIELLDAAQDESMHDLVPGDELNAAIALVIERSPLEVLE